MAEREFNLSDAQYATEVGFLFDAWRLFGKTDRPGFPDGVYTSTPAAFDEETDTMTTASGTVYHIVSFATDKASVVAQIKEDIVRGGFRIR